MITLASIFTMGAICFGALICSRDKTKRKEHFWTLLAILGFPIVAAIVLFDELHGEVCADNSYRKNCLPNLNAALTQAHLLRSEGKNWL